MEIQLQEVMKYYKEALADAQEEIFLRKALEKQLEDEIARLKDEVERLHEEVSLYKEPVQANQAQ